MGMELLREKSRCLIWKWKPRRWRKDLSLPSPPLVLFLSLSIHPPVCQMRQRRNRIHFITPGLTQKNPQHRALRHLASLCQNAAMRRSSVDKLPPPASFFTSAASSSNTYALTQNPCALLGDNKNNRWNERWEDKGKGQNGGRINGCWGVGGRRRKQAGANMT